MTIISRVLATAAALLLAHSPATLAEDAHPSTESPAGDEVHLSAALHDLLNREMQALENGMQELVPAIASGEWDNVASIAQKISDSFIMKQNLTPEQKHELQRALPARFIEMDQAFHGSAAMMAHAAEAKNADVVNFYFFKLNNACVGCHKQYAVSRFPGLAGSGEAATHQH